MLVILMVPGSLHLSDKKASAGDFNWRLTSNDSCFAVPLARNGIMSIWLVDRCAKISEDVPRRLVSCRAAGEAPGTQPGKKKFCGHLEGRILPPRLYQLKGLDARISKMSKSRA